MKFIQARWYTPVSGTRRIDFIVLHDMEALESATTAEAVAHDFATRSPANKASCHFCVDSDSIVQCVKENDIAYHAPPNTHSIGIEHAGYARQTKAQWRDKYSAQMLTLSAELTAELCTKHGIPVRLLSPEDLRLGKRGITTHANVSAAWHQTTHTDPGPNFPMAWYLDMVKAALVKPPAVNAPAKPPVSVPTTQELLEMKLSDKVTVPKTYHIAKETGQTEWTVEQLLARVAEWSFLAAYPEKKG